MKKIVILSAIAALVLPGIAVAAESTRPAAVSFATTRAPMTFGSSARSGSATGAKSGVDDGTTLILIAAAGVAGFFLHDIIDDDQDFCSSPPCN